MSLAPHRLHHPSLFFFRSSAQEPAIVTGSTPPRCSSHPRLMLSLCPNPPHSAENLDGPGRKERVAGPKKKRGKKRKKERTKVAHQTRLTCLSPHANSFRSTA